jgi:hypothetical protein
MRSAEDQGKLVFLPTSKIYSIPKPHFVKRTILFRVCETHNSEIVALIWTVPGCEVC